MTRQMRRDTLCPRSLPRFIFLRIGNDLPSGPCGSERVGGGRTT